MPCSGNNKNYQFYNKILAYYFKFNIGKGLILAYYFKFNIGKGLNAANVKILLNLINITIV